MPESHHDTAPDPMADLTDAQRQAVAHVDGALLVLAGPGSGKTRVITRRVANLIAQGIPAWNILAVTFTNKAAGEMRERIDALVPASVPGRRGLTVCTFHALCTRLLRRYADCAGLDPAFVIYDAADQREALKAAILEADLSSEKWTPGTVQSAISKAKNELLAADDFASRAVDFRSRQIARIFTAYERILASSRALDFDDLLLRTARLLERHEGVRRELGERFRYLLVDEYQDTNLAQFVIARAIAGGHGNICVVGDPDQSIYGWRGADIRNILEFEEHFPNATVVALGENFRSTGHIVAAAASLIDHNGRRKPKRLFTSLGEGEPVGIISSRNERHEAQVVLDHVRTWSEADVPYREMAVLYRMNALSRVIEDALRDAGVPYHIVRGTAFYDRKEIRDVLAYLRLVCNSADSVSLGRVVNFPPRGLGDTSLLRIEGVAASQGVPLLAAMSSFEGLTGLTARARAAAGAFATMVARWREDARASGAVGSDSLAALVSQVVRESGLGEHYRKLSARSEDETGEDRLANIDELITAAAQFTAPVDEVRPIETLPDLLGAWLESVALVADSDALDSSKGAVTLMTLHAAKGLEYDAVAIVGLEHGLLPHARSRESDAELEEERRLCFVGMTRARRHLLLSSARYRTQRGILERTIESPFLRELPATSVARLDLSGGDGERDFDGVDPPFQDDEFAPRRGFGRGSGQRSSGAGAYSPWSSTRPAAAGRDVLRGLVVGCAVRHPQFGLGRVESIMPRGPSSTVRVRFTDGGVKTLVIEFANLERV